MRKTLAFAAVIVLAASLFPAPASALPLHIGDTCIAQLWSLLPEFSLLWGTTTKIGPGIDPLGTDGDGSTDDGVRIDPNGAPSPPEGGASSTPDGTEGG